MKPFKELIELENKKLLTFPAYISLHAADSDGKLDKSEKKSAITFSHIKTYSCDPLLTEFYEEADKVFKRNIEELDKELPKKRKRREAAIKNELSELEKIVLKLGKAYTSTMHRSMKSFKDHVLQAHNSMLVNFIFPIPIKGITY